MDILPHDFVSLPIIITDWDAVQDTKTHVRAPTAEIKRSQAVDKKEQADEKLGIAESVEEIWSRISDAMKLKLREACIEVLRRTEVTDETKIDLHCDDDARFLD